MASISSLGIGVENYNLTQDTIDKLRKVDEEAMLKPVKKRVDKNLQQKEDYQTIVESLKILQTSSSYFGDELSYLKRSTTYSGDGGTIEANSGVLPSSGQIYVEQLATKSIFQSKGFAKTTDPISSSGDETLTMQVGDDTIEIDINAGMSLEELREEINSNSKDLVEASILNVGGDNPYTLVIKSKESGLDNEITINLSNEDSQLSFDEIQKAGDAKFDFNGVSITRSTNTITDLMVGVTINLQEAGEYINYSITQDLDEMLSKFEEFVETYNSVVSILNEATKYDVDSGESGSFQGDTTISSIRSQVNDIILGYADNGKSLANYGLDINEKGILSLDSAKFQEEMTNDPETFEAMMRGETKITEAVLTNGKTGYEKVEEINADGTTSYEYIPLQEDITIEYGSVRINGVPLPQIELLASNSAEENTQILAKAINDIADNTGVKATLSASGDRVILTEELGGRIEISEASEDAQKYLGFINTVSSGSVEYTDGIFSDLSDYFDSLIVGENSTLGLLGKSLDYDSKRLEEEIDAVTERLDKKYDIMAQQFAQYSKIIKQFESDFNSLKMQIDTLTAKKQ